MFKRIFITLIFLGLIFGGVFGWKAFVNSKIEEAMSNRKPPPATVSAMPAEKQVWSPILRAVATLQAVQGVDVTGEVPGLITDIHFQSGQKVDKGDLLLELDMSTDRAQLQSLLAAQDLARVQYKRMQNLVRRNMGPQSDLDEAEAKYKQAQAEVTKQRALIDKKQIRAPFTGILGIRQVDLGQYLRPGTPIVTLQAMRPIYVNFTVAQKNLDQLDRGQEVSLRVDTWPEKTFQGRITAINAKVSSSSRNVSIQATLDNTQGILRPGMYGTVEVQFGRPREVITLPQTAISSNPYGDVVFVLQKLDKDKEGQSLYEASRRFVHTGETRGDQVAVVKGLKPEDLVVTVGQHKLREGSKALVDNDVKPAFSRDPEVPDT